MAGPPAHDESPKDTADELLDVVLQFDSLKSVDRQNPTLSTNRRENTAEHSWSLALAVLVFRSLAAETLDIGRAVALATAHDLPEAFVGDTFVYGDGAPSRHAREVAAMDKFLGGGHQDGARARLTALWREYETCETPEARYVYALDVLMPIFLNGRRHEDSSWRRHGVSAVQVRSRVRSIERYVPALALRAFEEIDRAVAAGALRP